MDIFSPVGFDKVDVTGGFWLEKQSLVRNVSIHNVYKRFCDTGRFESLNFNWKEGDPDRPHIFWDSDIAKWLESAAYLIKKSPEPELEKIVDDTVDLIGEKQMDDGYFNIHFQMFDLEHRFTYRTDHELYCAGHLIEAAVAYYQATGKDKFLKIMLKYVDLIEKTFMIDKSANFTTPGHEEIELALVKLYHLTNDKRHLELSKFFIDMRGNSDGNDEGKEYNGVKVFYSQSHLPCAEQTTAEGHSVRAVYLYAGMIDIAREYGDTALEKACITIFENIINKRMYITGGIGSAAQGEMFTVDYDLPNKAAYSESCAALGLALFARRMTEVSADSIYADTIERVIYNGFLSSISLDGKSFFYENPLEVDLYLHEKSKKLGFGHFPPPHRFEVFGCSCCPPNITRFISSIGDMLYTHTDDAIFVQQYMTSTASFDVNDSLVTLTQCTDYPYNGVISVKYSGKDGMNLKLRIPGWCDNFTITANGLPVQYAMQTGYACIKANDGDAIVLSLTIDTYLVESNTKVQNNAGRCAVMRGPIVFCAEGVDNGTNLHNVYLDSDAVFDVGFDADLKVVTLVTNDAYVKETDENAPLYSKKTNSYDTKPIKLIPYYAFANRGDSDMLVWLRML